MALAWMRWLAGLLCILFIDLAFALKEYNRQGICHHLAWLIAALEAEGYIPGGLFQAGTAESAAKLQIARDVCRKTGHQAAPDLITETSCVRPEHHESARNENGHHVPEIPTEVQPLYGPRYVYS